MEGVTATPESRARALDNLRVDWNRVLLDLRCAGFSDAALAERLDIPKSTLAGYRILDAEPSWSNGQRIIALWCECTGSWPDGLPRAARI